jgi:hypothetical protein
MCVSQKRKSRNIVSASALLTLRWLVAAITGRDYIRSAVPIHDDEHSGGADTGNNKPAAMRPLSARGRSEPAAGPPTPALDDK